MPSPMGEEMVTITRDEYLNLQQDSDHLIALQSSGVDNWMHASDALNEPIFEVDGKMVSFLEKYD